MAVGYSKSNTSPILKLFLSHPDLGDALFDTGDDAEKASEQRRGAVYRSVGKKARCAEAFTVPSMTIDAMYRAIVEDFEVAWQALAAHGPGGGNFLFARQAVLLLEWACRLCVQDTTGEALRAFSVELRTRDVRYFTAVPRDPLTFGGFTLPYDLGASEKRTLLSLIFDLVRNGAAHQYEQITAKVNGGYCVVSTMGTYTRLLA